jgi:site-specific recombinase XerD
MKSKQRLFNQALNHIGKNWSKSSLTREKLINNIRHIATFMADQGLQHIRHMKTKHVFRFIDGLKGKGLAPSTMQNYATALRLLARNIGKPHIVPEKNEDLGIVRNDRYKPITANREKLVHIREQLAQQDERLLAAYDLRTAFGLRAKESLLSHQVAEREGRFYLVVQGAKGGRPRHMPIENEQQAQAVKQVQRIISESGTKTLIPAEQTLKGFYNYQRNTLYALGARRSDGSSMHSQRHAFAQDEIADGKSKAEVQNKLGHGETRTLKHYDSGA